MGAPSRLSIALARKIQEFGGKLPCAAEACYLVRLYPSPGQRRNWALAWLLWYTDAEGETRQTPFVGYEPATFLIRREVAIGFVKTHGGHGDIDVCSNGLRK